MLALFRKAAAAPDTDPAGADLELRAARDRALAGDWTPVHRLIAASGRDWELRAHRFAVLATAAAQDPRWLLAWEAAMPGDPAVAVLRADTLLRQAAAARHTSREQSALAAQATQRAADLNPDDPYPWVARMNAMFDDGYRQADDFAASRREALRRDPHNFEAHLSAMSFAAAKWYGTHDEMFTAARSAAAAAPSGSPTTMLPLLAHFEYARREFGPSSTSHKAYFRRTDVTAEVICCAGKWQAPGPARPTGRGTTVRHWLALANYLSDQNRPATKTLLTEVGPYLGSTPPYAYFWPTQPEGFHTVQRWSGATP
ncbi:hypothetical protein [Actinoplanes sp. HUAS TT8]|uniref:hypothetical protein n=1 Tax=Actinoplanes sp. HUAS TT8 TaxID=3447453 RepID=UPI003F51D150